MLHLFKMKRRLHMFQSLLNNSKKKKKIHFLNKKYWSCIHFSDVKVHIESDQKRMLSIKEKALQNTPSPLQRMFLILWSYDIELKYLPWEKEHNGRNFIMYNSGRNNNRFSENKISWRIILTIWKHFHRFSLVQLCVILLSFFPPLSLVSLFLVF